MKITYLGKALKDLKVLADYVGIGKSADYTVLNFKNTIINNTNYDKDFYKEWLSTISNIRKEELKEKKEKRKEMLEDARRKETMWLELEKLRAEVKCTKNGWVWVEDSRNPSKELQNLI